MKTFHWKRDGDQEDSVLRVENAQGVLMAADKAVCVHCDMHQVVETDENYIHESPVDILHMTGEDTAETVAPNGDIPLCRQVEDHRMAVYSGGSQRDRDAGHNTMDARYNLPFEEGGHESYLRNSAEELLVVIMDACCEAWEEDKSHHEDQVGAVVF